MSTFVILVGAEESWSLPSSSSQRGLVVDLFVLLIRIDGPVLVLCVDYEAEGEILDDEKESRGLPSSSTSTRRKKVVTMVSAPSMAIRAGGFEKWRAI